MFDVAFSEIVVIAVVALIVIGPEKLPKVARTLGLLTGRMQRYVSSVKADIDRELRVEDLRKAEEDARHSILGMKAEISAEAGNIENSITTPAENTTSPDSTDKPQTPA